MGSPANEWTLTAQSSSVSRWMLAQAIWNGVALAESDQCMVVEGTYYFPPEAVNRRYLRESATHTTYSWKGVANYYDVVVDGQINTNAA
jgi:uncharacterized protein (DUF427 family)